MSEELEVCPVHGCTLEDFISATEEGTEYFTYCPKCQDELNEIMLKHNKYNRSKNKK